MVYRLEDLEKPFTGPGAKSHGGSRALGIACTAVNSVIVLDSNSNRKRATFVNDSVEDIYLSKGPLAAVNTGILLVAAGGAWTLEPTTTGYMWYGEISAIGGAGAALNLCVTEDW